MLTLALYGLLAIGLMGALFLLAVRVLPAGEQIAPPVRDEPVWTLPADRSITAADIEQLRLPVALRGYRFAETDDLLDRLVVELGRRDAELDRLRSIIILMPPEAVVATAATMRAEDDADRGTDRGPDRGAERAADHGADDGADRGVERAADHGADLGAANEVAEDATNE